MPACERVFLCPTGAHLDPLTNLPIVLQEPDMVAVLIQSASVRDFIRDNFGLYSPPGDYAALRRENLRRSLDPTALSRCPQKGR